MTQAKGHSNIIKVVLNSFTEHSNFKVVLTKSIPLLTMIQLGSAAWVPTDPKFFEKSYLKHKYYFALPKSFIPGRYLVSASPRLLWLKQEHEVSFLHCVAVFPNESAVSFGAVSFSHK